MAKVAADTKRTPQEILNNVFDEDTNTLAVNADVTVTSDIEIGAVEIKNSTDDTRATVTARGLQVEPSGAVADNAADSGNPVKVGGKYVAAGVTLDDGDRGNMQLDVNGRQIITSGTLFEGEDQTYHRMRSMPAYNYSAIAVADVQIKGSAGILHSVTFSCADAAPTAGDIKIYDNTAESGTVVFHHNFTTTPFMPFTVILDYIMLTGIYVGFSTTADVNVSCAYL